MGERQNGMSSEVVEVAVIGLHGTGKSTLISTISQRTAQDDVDGDAWRYGQVDVSDALTLQFVEPPSRTTFDFLHMRDLVESLDVAGYIVVLDSTTPEGFGEFVSVLYTIRSFHSTLPVVVAANKQDEPRAWNTTDVQAMLQLDADIPVMPCVATDFEAVRNVVLRLMYTIFND